ncbi:MAG TPA: hypothetical protein VFY81_07020 [Gammaproteobacteria bacterium]|nr:hypothetical protein [Gammaproteobacteria bacterium]
MRTIFKPAVVVFALAMGSAAYADALLLDKVQQDAPQSADRPTRGMTMDAVASRFGEPAERIAAVGEPPISRWVYDGYIVYFEKDRVLHSVARR